MFEALTHEQKSCYDRFINLKVGAIFMKMGMGKTRVALELVNSSDAKFLLFLCPFSAIDNINDEIQKWGINCEYRIVGYESIAQSNKKYLEIIEEIKQYEKPFIIADESIFIKNGKTKRFKRACEIRKYCEYALILNGTPVVKNERDLFNQFQFLSEKILNMTYGEFLDKFFVKHMQRKRNIEFVFYTFYEPNRPAFLKMIQPYVFQADLEFKKDEKSKFFYIEDATQSRIYEEKKEEILNNYLDLDSNTIINMFVDLHKIASCSKAKNDELVDYIKGKRIICYCSFIEELEYIKNKCDCYTITGATKRYERYDILNKFKCDTKPLLITFGVGSYSLNLQFCNEIVYSSITFNFADMEQSMYRIKRIGQKDDIRYTYFLMDCGINDIIKNNITSKNSLSYIIKEEISRIEKNQTRI